MKNTFVGSTGVLRAFGLCALAIGVVKTPHVAYAQQNVPVDATRAVPPPRLTITPQALPYLTGENHLIAQLPDEMITVIDPNVVGHNMRYQSPSINDSGFVKTKTYSTSWEAQGLGALRRGAVWYRHRFTLPADVKGKPVGLFLGGYQDEARVWINGKLVGTSGETTPPSTGPNSPDVPSAAFDLTDGINYDGQNLVAIQIVRHGPADSARQGGLLRQSFLFTGPRLPQKANKPLELRRKLPNGELGDIEN